jgi:site-specific recombinase XerD
MHKLSPHPLPPLLEAFLCQRLPIQRQLSPNTVASYRDSLRLLLQFVQQQTHRAPHQQVLEDWDAPCILAFLKQLDTQRNNGARTRNLRLTALHVFMSFAAEQAPEVLALTARVLAIPMKRFDRPLLGCLSPTEMQAILAAPSPDTRNGQRDRVLFELLYNTGARVSEIAALNRQDVQTQPPAAVVLQGKGRKQRLVPLWKSTATHLQRWLDQHPAPPQGPLFTNHSGQRISRFGIACRFGCALAQAARRCPSLAGRKISPHWVRHATALHLLQAGNDITLVALWLGHESPATTHQYLALDLAQKERCLQKLAPPTHRAPRFKPGDPLLRLLQNL